MATVTFTILNDRKKAFLRSNIILRPRMFMQIRIPINVTEKKRKKKKKMTLNIIMRIFYLCLLFVIRNPLSLQLKNDFQLHRIHQ